MTVDDLWVRLRGYHDKWPVYVQIGENNEPVIVERVLVDEDASIVVLEAGTSMS